MANKHLWTYTRLILVLESHSRRRTPLPCFHTRKKRSLAPGQSSPAILLSLNSFDSQEPVPGGKYLVVSLEKRTVSYLSVSARIRVIDPFRQMKREYLTIIPRAGMGSESTAHE